MGSATTNSSSSRSWAFTKPNTHYSDEPDFCTWLSQKEGKQYRLPAGAEWEYCCRAGTTTRFHSGNDDDSVKRVARCDLGIGKGTGVGGQYKPNAFGLYDMHGNVWEWCEDWYDEFYYSASPAQDPQGPSDGKWRVIRGGSFSNPPRDCRASVRAGIEPASRGFIRG